MRQWEIWEFPFPDATMPHPCIVVSPNSVCTDINYPVINVLPCQSLRPGMRRRANEFFIDQSDGLDNETLVKYSVIQALPKTLARIKRGELCETRRRDLSDALSRFYDIRRR